MPFYLGDDGTLDTVIVCSECGKELRYTFDPDTTESGYDDFVGDVLWEAEQEHVCEEDLSL